MQALIPDLIRAMQSPARAVYCRLVATRGSTPQKAGAAMLVFEGGSQAGTLGGGCVEAEVKRKALEAIETQQTFVQRFLLDSDYGWDDGLICGGRMDVLVHPLTRADSAEYFREFCEVLSSGRGCTEVVSCNQDLEASEQEPALLLFNDDGDFVASACCPDLESHLQKTQPHLRPLRERPGPYVHGAASYLPLLSRCRLLIVGAGHVGKAVAELAANLEFDVCIVDDREEFVTEDRFPNAQQRLHGPLDRLLPNVKVDESTYCLIVTRGHNHDEKALYYLADRGAAYVGMIGSQRKVRLIMEDLLAEGVRKESLDAVYAPVGVDIGSQSVAEIAVSICAQLIAVRSGKACQKASS